MRRRHLACLILALAGSVGCSSSSGTETDPLMVLETAPADGESMVQLEVVLGVRFDEDLDPATLTTQTLTLSEADGTQVPGTVRLGGNADVAVFTPDEPLSIITDYQATVTTGLLDIRGRALEEDFTWRFRTLDDEWGDPSTISQNISGNAQAPQIGTDSTGQAVAVWLESDGVRDSVMASHFTRQNLWSDPEPIEAHDESAGQLRLAVNQDGEAVAVWRERAEPNDRIWANRYTVADGWGIPQAIEADAVVAGGIATTPAVTIDSQGNATVAWYQTDIMSGAFNVWASRYTSGEDWGAAEILETEPPAFRQPSIALASDAAGNVTAIWTRRGLTQDDVWANRYTIGQGWGTAERIEGNDTGPPTELAIVAASDGDVHAVWSQPDDGDVTSLWTNVYSAGAWGTAALLDEEDTNAADSPSIAAGPMGALQLVWSQSDGTVANIWANRYTTADQWGTPTLIEVPLDPGDDGDAREPRIAVDQEGNAFAVWQQFDGARFSIWSNRYTPEDGWFEAEMIEADRGTAILPQIAVSPGRRAQAVWQQQQAGGPTVIRTNRFE